MKITVIVFHDGIVRRPVVVKVENSLRALQALVGLNGSPAFIEPVRVPGNRTLLVDEEGLQKSLPPNVQASAVAGKILVGTAVMVRTRGADFVSVTDADIRCYGAVSEAVDAQRRP